MKRSSCLFLAILSISFKSSPTPSTALLSLSSMAKKGVFYGGILALIGAGFFKTFHLKCSTELEELKKKAFSDPFPDSPEKRKMTEKLTKEGYEVYFVKAPWFEHIQTFSYRKKVIFSIACVNGQCLLFTHPHYASSREGTIVHEIGHVRNNDTTRKAYFRTISGTLMCAATGLTMAGTTALTRSPLFSRLLVGSKISPPIQKALSLTLRTSATLVTGAAILCGSYGVWLLADSAFCRYQEQQADAAVVTLQNRLVLDGMAQAFEEESKNDSPNKTCAQWFIEKMKDHPSDASRALFFRKRSR